MLEFPWGPRSRPYPRSSPRSSSFQFESRSRYLVPRNRDLLSFQRNRAYPSLVLVPVIQASFQLSKPRSRSSLSKPRSSLSGTSPRVVPASFHRASPRAPRGFLKTDAPRTRHGRATSVQGCQQLLAGKGHRRVAKLGKLMHPVGPCRRAPIVCHCVRACVRASVTLRTHGRTDGRTQ